MIRSQHALLLVLAASFSACASAPPPPPPDAPASPATASPSASPAPSATSASAPSPARAPAIRPLFAPLFEASRTWKYQVTSTDPTSKKKTTKQTTCRVDQVRAFATGTLSKIVCADDKGQPASAGESPAGIYLANAEGLWNVENRPVEDLAKAREEDLASPRGEELVLKASPAAGNEKGNLPGRKENDDEDGSWGYERKITREGDVWCSTVHFLGGEETKASICLREGTGPVRGTSALVTGVGPDVRWQEAR
jgi:hypothetical protein